MKRVNTHENCIERKQSQSIHQNELTEILSWKRTTYPFSFESITSRFSSKTWRSSKPCLSLNKHAEIETKGTNESREQMTWVKKRGACYSRRVHQRIKWKTRRRNLREALKHIVEDSRDEFVVNRTNGWFGGTNDAVQEEYQEKENKKK